MLKHYLLAIIIGCSIFPAFSATVPSKQDNSPTPAAKWNCWGRKEVNMSNRNINNKSVSLKLSTDICDRKDLRPLFIDVYLHKISFKGEKYDGITIDIIANATHKLTGKTQEIRSTENINNIDEHVQRLQFSAVRSGDYNVDIKQIWLIFRDHGKAVGSFQITGDNARNGEAYIESHITYNAMLSLIENAKSETLTTGKPSHIVFGGHYEIPMNAGSGTYTLANNGNLLIIPRIHEKEKYLIPHLLGDTHQGEAARCEGNTNAKTQDGTLQTAELYTPEQAWIKLGKPLVALNANYFDVRPQLNNSTWQSNLCSVPLGIYYDNIAQGPTHGTHNEPNQFFAGPNYFINNNNEQIALDALFWVLDQTSRIDIYYSKKVSDPAIELYANELSLSGYHFIAIAGSGLPVRGLTPLPTPDSGDSETTRLAMGADDNNSLIYIFQGGSYREGISRNDLHHLYYGLSIAQSMELDGGGSAALALKADEFTVRGDTRPDSSCNEAGLWCSLITQPDGKHRPVPSWIGLAINNLAIGQ